MIEITCIPKPFDPAFPGFDWFITERAQTEHWVGKDVGLGICNLNRSITLQSCFSPRRLVPGNRGKCCDLRTSQLTEIIAPQTSKIDSWRIVSSMNNLVHAELQHEEWRIWICTKLLCSHRDPSCHPSVSNHKSFLRSRRLSPCEVHSLVIYGNDVAKFDIWVLNLLNLLELRDFLKILGVQLAQASLCWWTVEHPFAILEIRRCVGIVILICACMSTWSSSPLAWIILFSSDCSCILFAIVLVQLVKLKFWAQQRELTWLM